MRLVFALAAALALGASGVAQTPAPSAADLARRIQAHYDKVADFSADFTVSYRYEMAQQASMERGDVKVKKPNRMRWTYVAPDRKEFVADGSMLYMHFPQDKSVRIAALPQAGDAPVALLFLAGKGDLTRDFTATTPAEHPAGEWRLTLTPKTRQDDYQSLTLSVRRDTLALTGLVMVDDMGTQTFRFTKFLMNRGLADTVFHFKIPKGTDIIK
jgi:outer membrane lipoprotein carrier protein